MCRLVGKRGVKQAGNDSGLFRRLDPRTFCPFEIKMWGMTDGTSV